MSGQEGCPDRSVHVIDEMDSIAVLDHVFPNGDTLVVKGRLTVPQGVPMMMGSFRILVPDSFPIGASRPHVKQFAGEQSKFASRIPELSVHWVRYRP